MGAIYRREMGAFFQSPTAYVYLGIFYVFAGYFFAGTCLSANTSDMSNFFSNFFLIIVFLIPIITMRLFSEELKQKTDQGLFTAPVSTAAIVFGKYFAALTLYIMGTAVVFIYGGIMSIFATVNWGIILSNFFALFLLGTAFVAIGLFVSALTENQIIADIGAFAILMFFYLMDLLISNVSIEWLYNILKNLSFYTRYYEFTCGLFDLSSVIFYLSVAAVFLFLNIRALERKRWN